MMMIAEAHLDDTHHSVVITGLAIELKNRERTGIVPIPGRKHA
jgi:hypothetical protein